MKQLMRGLLAAAAMFVAACGSDSPPAPPVPTTITFTPGALTFDAIAATASLSIVVKDGKGRPMDNVPVTWSQTGTSITLTPPPATATGSATHTASAAAVSEGQTLVTVTAGNISATLNVVVDQKAASIVVISGDNQIGAMGQALPEQITVQLRDRIGIPLTDEAVVFEVVDGGGSVSPPSTALNGIVTRTTWTLGAVGTQHLRATDAAHTLTPITFTATGTAVPAAIVFAPSAVAIDAIGAVVELRVTVNDAAGGALTFAPVTWTATGNSLALQAPGSDVGPNNTHRAIITSVAEGETVIRATSGGVTSTLTIVVDQKPASIVVLSGNNQVAAPGSPLAQPIAVQLRDGLGAAIKDVAIAFTVVDGGGSVSPPSSLPGADGIAQTNWTLGTAPSEHLSVGDINHVVSPVTVTATTTAAPVGLVAAGGGNQAVIAGTNAPTPPAVKVVDATGAGVQGVVVNFAVTAGAGSINAAAVTTGADGVAALTRWTMGPVGTLNAVTATAGTLPTLEFDDAGCDNGAATGFAITLCYRTTMTASQRQAFVSAASKWGTIITSDLEDVSANFPSNICGGTMPTYSGNVDDLLIFATVGPIDGPNGIVGSAGPCVIRPTGGLPIIGTMTFDSADLVALDNAGLLSAVILHEMGHVLGIGTFWKDRNLLVNPSTASQALDTYFTGMNGIAGFDAIGGTSYSGNKVPVANVGGAGTINGHWRENVLQNELMTGTINNGSNPLSLLTVRSLQDLGYTVNTANADPFFLSLAVTFPGAPTGGISLGNDMLTFPLWTVDAKGRMNRKPR